MSATVQLTFDLDLYDEGAVRETAARFDAVAQVECRVTGDSLTVTLVLDEEDADRVGGELVNIALARTLEVRAGEVT